MRNRIGIKTTFNRQNEHALLFYPLFCFSCYSFAPSLKDLGSISSTTLGASRFLDPK
jgi:hypothetical protein